MRNFKLSLLFFTLASSFKVGAFLIPVDSLVSVNNIKKPDRNYCDLNIIERPAKTVHLPYNLNYFISAAPDGNEVGIILPGQNRIVEIGEIRDGENLEIFENDYEAPGPYDPVFTPDGKYLTVPYFEKNPGTYFFTREQIKKSGSKAIAALKDAKNGHRPYQSVGQPNLKKQEYNYISDPEDISPNKNIQFTKVKKEFFGGLKAKKTKSLCPGKITGNLPMISTDGKYLSYLDEQTQTTKIMFIGKDGNECREVLDLGFPTGKISFNFDQNNRQIAFHVTRSHTKKGWFSEVGENFSTDIFVMDIDSFENDNNEEEWEVVGMKRLSQTGNPQTGTYYPRFTRDGGIIAASRDVGPNGQLRSNLVQYTPDQVENLSSTDMEIDNSVIDINTISCENLAVSAIGALFSSVCEALPIEDELKDSFLLAQSIDLISCRNLVEDFWNRDWIPQLNVKSDVKSAYAQISQEEVLAACPAVDGSVTKRKESPILTKSNIRDQSDHDIFSAKCYDCHNPGSPNKGLSFFEIDGSINTENNYNYAGLNGGGVEKSILSILSKDPDKIMPPDEDPSLDVETRARVAQYLLDNYHDSANFSSEYTREELQACITQYSSGGNCEID